MMALVLRSTLITISQRSLKGERDFLIRFSVIRRPIRVRPCPHSKCELEYAGEISYPIRYPSCSLV